VFLARTVPASSRAKPHCMKKTRKPQSMSQNVSACVAPKYGADATAVEIIEATSVELTDMSERAVREGFCRREEGEQGFGVGHRASRVDFQVVANARGERVRLAAAWSAAP